MMTPYEFCEKINGAPWVNRGHSFEGADCYGVVLLYYKEVLGIELPIVSGYKQGLNYADCSDMVRSQDCWERIAYPEQHAVAFSHVVDGRPMHISVCIDRKNIIHAVGLSSSGIVKVNSVVSLIRSTNDVFFNRFIGDE